MSAGVTSTSELSADAGNGSRHVSATAPSPASRTTTRPSLVVATTWSPTTTLAEPVPDTRRVQSRSPVVTSRTTSRSLMLDATTTPFPTLIGCETPRVALTQRSSPSDAA